MKNLLYISIFLLALMANGQNNLFFEKGNAHYNEGEFQEAVDTYEKILETGNHSAELYYNLANAYYKLNRVAPSIYYYEKALQLAPKDEDILNNIEFARNMTIDDIEVIPEMGYTRLMKGLINTMSSDGWAYLSIASVLAFVLLFLGYYFSHSTARKRLSFLGSAAALLLAMLTLFLAYQKFELDQNDNPAIVFVDQSEIKSEPNLRSEIAFVLHEGTKVVVLEKYNENWVKIRLVDGKTGWIPSDDIKEL